MPCIPFADGKGFICVRSVDAEARRIRLCPTEGKRRRMYGSFQFWYGWHVTCLGCGDSWEDGEQLPRPFKRAWRKDAVKRAKAQWAAAVPRKPDWDAFWKDYGPQA